MRWDGGRSSEVPDQAKARARDLDPAKGTVGTDPKHRN
jgi:hypothetical protein